MNRWPSVFVNLVGFAKLAVAQTWTALQTFTAGIISNFYSSAAVNVPSTGAIRLGNTELIAWRNAANDNDIDARVDVSDRYIIRINGNENWRVQSDRTFFERFSTGAGIIDTRSQVKTNGLSVGQLDFFGLDASDVATEYARMIIPIRGVGTGGSYRFDVRESSSLVPYFECHGGGQDNRCLKTLTITDGKNIVLGTTTGTIFGTSNSQKLAFYNSTPIIQVVHGSNLTNNVTGGGVNDTIANYTLGAYAADRQTIKNNFFQLARSVKVIQDGLRLYGLLS